MFKKKRMFFCVFCNISVRFFFFCNAYPFFTRFAPFFCYFFKTRVFIRFTRVLSIFIRFTRVFIRFTRVFFRRFFPRVSKRPNYNSSKADFLHRHFFPIDAWIRIGRFELSAKIPFIWFFFNFSTFTLKELKLNKFKYNS